MKQVPTEQVLRRMAAENVWWSEPHVINDSYRKMRRRAYFDLLYPLIAEVDVRRAVLLMGPRRVGKTVLLHHVVQQLLDDGIPPEHICYLSVDHPIYNNCDLHDLVRHYCDLRAIDARKTRPFIVFDEIQYIREWEVQLKTLVDSYPEVHFMASGSAAAALRLKSNESGAGRFTDFLLPPLTFYEYLDLLDRTNLVTVEPSVDGKVITSARDIAELNRAFIHYLNYGGYPEVVFSETIQSDPARFIKGDIIDKVLLRDLPGLYGIQDIQELNYLFTTLAFNTANEISLEQLAQSSGVAKNTIRRYIEYLEAAFLVKVVHRIDRSGRRFQRANFFKVYLTNPSMRSALFSPISEDDEAMGDLAETGIFSQWFHSDTSLHYARWEQGEVDIVYLGPSQKPVWAVEVKWTDRFVDRPSDLRSLISFCAANNLRSVSVTSRTMTAERSVGNLTLRFRPTSLYCFTVGYNLIRKRKQPFASVDNAVNEH